LFDRSPPAPLVRDLLVRQRVLVTLTTQQGFAGVAWQSDATGLLLVAAAGEPVTFVDADGGEGSPVDGQVWVPADRILFVQLVEGG
jgi:hypothetical protein